MPDIKVMLIPVLRCHKPLACSVTSVKEQHDQHVTQNPVDSVQVPQTVESEAEVAFNVVGQSGLAPMFQVQAVADQPLPG